MMLEHFGYTEAADAMMRAIETALGSGDQAIITPDLGGKGTCSSLGSHIASLISKI